MWGWEAAAGTGAAHHRCGCRLQGDSYSPDQPTGNGSAFTDFPYCQANREGALLIFHPPKSQWHIKFSKAPVEHFRRGRTNFRWQPRKYLHIWYLCTNNFIHHVEFPYRFCRHATDATFLVIFRWSTARKPEQCSCILYIYFFKCYTRTFVVLTAEDLMGI